MSARAEVAVGMSSCGIAAGARVVFASLQKDVAARGLPFSVVATGCIGACHAEPLVEVRQADGKTFLYGNVDEARAHSIVEAHLVGGTPVGEMLVPADYPYLARQRRIVLSNCGVIDPESIEQYIARDGYAALKKVLTGMTPEAVIEEVKTSGMRGRGGAGFPTGMKWAFAREAKSATGKKYVICNADEGDPGAFMDRSVLEGDPHAVLEGMLICAFAVGADEGYIYVRAEYPLAIKRLQIALKQMEERNLLGDCTSRRAPEPSSAAKRPPSWARSRESAACRGFGLLSRPCAGCGIPPPTSTTWKHTQISPPYSAWAARATPPSARRKARGPRSSPLPARSSAAA
jgi:NADH-quinone oxidoreductase subunit F